jgi:hypothetical protein
VSESLNNQEISSIIKGLSTYNEHFPREAMSRAMAFGPTIVPALLERIDFHLDRTLTFTDTDNKDFIDDSQWQIVIISLYLLSWFKAKEAFSRIERICYLSREFLDTIIGDGITVSLSKFLASTFNGDFDALKRIASNPDLDEYARAGVFSCYVTLLRYNVVSRDKVIADFAECFEILKNDDTYAHSELILCTSEIFGVELQDKIEQAFNRGVIDRRVINEKTIAKAFRNNKDLWQQALQNHPYRIMVGDPIAAMDWWYCWKENQEDDNAFLERLEEMKRPLEKKRTKIGRNDPCPCGSGKKYKKCCIVPDARSIARSSSST